MNQDRRRNSDKVAEEGSRMAQQALQRINTHEEVCTERYKQIVQNQIEARAERRDMHEQNQRWIATLSNRMWVSAGGVIVSLLGLIATLVATRGHP